MKPGQKLAFLGGGNMAEAMIKGLLRARTATPEQITVSVRRADREEELRRLYKVEVSRNNPALAAAAEVVILSVKPQVMGEMLDLVAPSIGPNHLVISVAAGVPIAAIERKLGPTARVIRAMPNTPALVGQGACAVSAGSHSTEADMEIAKSIFDSVGMTVVVEEYLLDAVTGLSGSGPAYIFLIIEALSDAGVKVGLPRRTAQALAAQTVAGSGSPPHRDRDSPRSAEGPGHLTRGYSDCRSPHVGGGRAPNDADQCGGSGHSAREGAREGSDPKNGGLSPVLKASCGRSARR